jgi:hypothetical protein
MPIFDVVLRALAEEGAVTAELGATSSIPNVSAIKAQTGI